MSIHSVIRNGRKRLDMTEQQFADAVGVTRGAVQQWEKEGGTAPKRHRQLAVVKLLGLSSVDELLDLAADAPRIAASPAPTAGKAIDELSPQALRLARTFDMIVGESLRNYALSELMPQVQRYITHPSATSIPAPGANAPMSTQSAAAQRESA